MLEHPTATAACMQYGIKPAAQQRQHLPPLPCRCYGWYSIYPPIKDERLSRPGPIHVNKMVRVTTEVSAIPGASCSAPLGTVGVNNLPTVVTY